MQLKIHLETIKEWINIDYDIEKISNDLTNIGFESYPINNNNILISVPSNRNDCLNLLGIIKEIACLYEKDLRIINKMVPLYKGNKNIKIKINNYNFCKHYVGRSIYKINNEIETPSFIKNELNNAGINSISIIVDILNFIMLEIGQPMQVYDLDKIRSSIIIDKNNDKVNNKIMLANNNSINLNENLFLTFSGKEVIAIPGIITGNITEINKFTKNIFLESALFDSSLIKSMSDFCKIKTKSSEIFINFSPERDLQNISIDRASELIIKYSGGLCSKIIKKNSSSTIKKKHRINLYKINIKNILGFDLDNNFINKIIKKIGASYKFYKNYWKIDVPLYRKDLLIEENIISELFKYYKNDNNNINITFKKNKFLINRNIINKFKNILLNRGFFEVINFGFVDKQIEKNINNENNLVNILNPISINMNVMRSSLFQGLIKNVIHNLNRQYENIHLFEVGNVFKLESNIISKNVIAGISTGAIDYNWNKESEVVNLFFLKNIIEQFLSKKKIIFSKINNETKDFLIKDSSLNVYLNNKNIGILGLVNNCFDKNISTNKNIYFFEINLEEINIDSIKCNKFSRLPKIIRDLSFVLDRNILYDDVKKFIESKKINLFSNFELINVYFFEKDLTKKSLTIRLFFENQDSSLKKENIENNILYFINEMKKKFNSNVRI